MYIISLKYLTAFLFSAFVHNLISCDSTDRVIILVVRLIWHVIVSRIYEREGCANLVLLHAGVFLKCRKFWLNFCWNFGERQDFMQVITYIWWLDQECFEMFCLYAGTLLSCNGAENQSRPRRSTIYGPKTVTFSKLSLTCCNKLQKGRNICWPRGSWYPLLCICQVLNSTQSIPCGWGVSQYTRQTDMHTPECCFMLTVVAETSLVNTIMYIHNHNDWQRISELMSVFL